MEDIKYDDDDDDTEIDVDDDDDGVRKATAGEEAAA